MFLITKNNLNRILLCCRRYVVYQKNISSTITIFDEDRDLLFIQSNIFIPKGSRCCRGHVSDGRLINDDLNQIRPREIIQISSSSSDILTWFDKFRNHYNSICYSDFDLPFAMSEFDCNNLTGITKLNFEHLIKLLVDSNIKHLSNRSLRNAIGLLTKLRLGISNNVLTTIFQISNPKAVSRNITAVRQAMLTHFVLYYFGFNHISRQEVINNHSSPLVTQLLTGKPNTVVLVIDGTDLYIQVRNVLTILRHTSEQFSMRNQIRRYCYAYVPTIIKDW